VPRENRAAPGARLRAAPPQADFLRNGIYELRVRLQRVNYRMLYFFHGNVAAVLSHGLIKEKQVPDREIDRAVKFRRKYLEDPDRHTHEEE
jgi:phage-related protein